MTHLELLEHLTFTARNTKPNEFKNVLVSFTEIAALTAGLQLLIRTEQREEAMRVN
jgi:hypothetical protein